MNQICCSMWEHDQYATLHISLLALQTRYLLSATPCGAPAFIADCARLKDRCTQTELQTELSYVAQPV